MSASVPRVLVSAGRIRERVGELAGQIAAEFLRRADGAPVVVLGVLNGSFIFLADLVRALPEPVECGFILLSSSPREDPAGSASRDERPAGIDLRLTAPVGGRRVLLVEDILDSGRTLEFVVARLLELGAVEVRTCVLLDKPSKRRAALRADWVGFSVPDVWVVGYGLDSEGRLRQLPHLAAIGGRREISALRE